MMTESGSETRRFIKPLLIAGCLAAAVVVYFLWEKHESHILGALFLILLLACPAMHFFMHRNHGHGGHGRDDSDRAKHSKRRAP